MRRRDLLRLGALVGGAAALPAPARALPRISLEDWRPLGLPPRSKGAVGGQAFAARVAGLSDRSRYEAAATQILSGNTPDFLRWLTPVPLTAEGVCPRVLIFALPDYLAVGRLGDFVRVPLDWYAAHRVASALDAALPTPRMVDAIYASARTVLTPAPMPPTAEMRSMDYTLRHQAMIEAERGDRPIAPLTAGHKKDLVITGRLFQMPDRVAIYGWHRPTGVPIQPLSLVHGAGYADYSHGVRLISRWILVDGAPMDLVDALADPQLAPKLTREGLLPGAEALL
jgi:hypothetical protein